MKNWNDFKRKALKDPKLLKEYEALGPQYEIASRLIELRLEKKLSQSDLARKIGTRQSAIARLESGNYNPSLKLLEKIAKATGVRLTIQFQS